MVAGLVCYGVVACLYVLAESLSQVFLVRLLHGIGAGMIWPALSAFIVDLAPMERRGETMGFLSGMEMMGFALGPLLGGFLYSMGGMNLPFWGCAALALLSAAVIWSMIQEKPSAKKPRPVLLFLKDTGFLHCGFLTFASSASSVLARPLSGG